MKEKMVGIYVIRDHSAGKAYIGSSVDMERRMTEHKNDLKAGKHSNIPLQKAYGDKNKMTVIVLPIIEQDQNKIQEMEQELITRFFDKGVLYNLKKTVLPSNVGFRPSSEMLDKCRLVNLGRKDTPEQIEVKRLRATGKTPSLETRRKMSVAQTGLKQSPEAIAKISLANKGRVASGETRQKMSDSAKSRADFATNISKINAIVSKPLSVDGVYYKSASAAARAHGVNVSTAFDRVKSSTVRFENWKFA